MTTPTTTWVIDCGHWHCPDRSEIRHGHTLAPDACPECAEERPQPDRAAELENRALRIAAAKHPVLSPDEREQPE